MASTANYQFVATRDMFKDHLVGYPEDLTFEEWKKADADDKAALLFVVFYQDITRAWYNAVTSKNVVHVTQEDAVSTVLQYLTKNVDIIGSPMLDYTTDIFGHKSTYKITNYGQRYTSSYIYSVSYNCLLNLWGTRGTDMQRSACEISNEYIDGDTVVDLWDLVPSHDEDFETAKVKEAVWDIIRRMGPKAEKVANNLINPDETVHKVSRRSSERPIDRLADVSVSKSEYEEIVAELKIKLAPYKEFLLGV